MRPGINLVLAVPPENGHDLSKQRFAGPVYRERARLQRPRLQRVTVQSLIVVDVILEVVCVLVVALRHVHRHLIARRGAVLEVNAKAYTVKD